MNQSERARAELDVLERILLATMKPAARDGVAFWAQAHRSAIENGAPQTPAMEA